MTKVLVTGMGVISSIGMDVASNRASLSTGKTGIGQANILDSRYTKIFSFGEIPISTADLVESLNLGGYRGVTRTEALAEKAIREAVTDAGLSKTEISSFDTAFISASTVGGMSATNQLYKDSNFIGEPSEYLSSYICAAHTLAITERWGLKGITGTINTACSSSANAIMYGARLIKSGRAKRAIVGGSDGLAKFTVNGFNALMILSKKPCSPFDRDRSGLTLGEGAGYLILESEEVVGDKKVYAEVSGYGNANDAFHPSSISDDAVGVRLSIEGAIETSGIEPSQIAYINMHGTGTENNDQTELMGCSKIFDKIPPFNSTKSYTGHTLAAAGSIESVFGILSMQHSELYPSLNFQHPIAEFDLSPIRTYQSNYPIEHLLTNSFGFGGNCSSVIFSKPGS